LFITYNEISQELRRDDNMNETEIRDLQIKMDSFFVLFLKMFGKDAVTNYIHLWGSGEIRWFLLKYGSIHRHNTIALEALIGYIRR